MEHRLLWDLTGPEIEAESFRWIDAEAAPEQRARFTAAEWHVARRLVHTTADFGILDFLKFTPGAVESGLAALRRGALIYTDSNMIKSGLSVPKLQKFHPGYTRDAILCPVADPATARQRLSSPKLRTTRETLIPLPPARASRRTARRRDLPVRQRPAGAGGHGEAGA